MSLDDLEALNAREHSALLLRYELELLRTTPEYEWGEIPEPSNEQVLANRRELKEIAKEQTVKEKATKAERRKERSLNDELFIPRARVFGDVRPPQREKSEPSGMEFAIKKFDPEVVRKASGEGVGY